MSNRMVYLPDSQFTSNALCLHENIENAIHRIHMRRNKEGNKIDSNALKTL